MDRREAKWQSSKIVRPLAVGETGMQKFNIFTFQTENGGFTSTKPEGIVDKIRIGWFCVLNDNLSQLSQLSLFSFGKEI